MKVRFQHSHYMKSVNSDPLTSPCPFILFIFMNSEPSDFRFQISCVSTSSWILKSDATERVT